jgi:hypothetical protein
MTKRAFPLRCDNSRVGTKPAPTFGTRAELLKIDLPLAQADWALRLRQANYLPINLVRSRRRVMSKYEKLSIVHMTDVDPSQSD